MRSLCAAYAQPTPFFLEKSWKKLSHFAYIKSGDRVPPPMNWLKMRFSRVLLFSATFSYFPLWDPLLTGGESYLANAESPTGLDQHGRASSALTA